MPVFNVRWEIEIEADTAEAAARSALEVQRDPTSIATVFDVNDIDDEDVIYTLDLSEE